MADDSQIQYRLKLLFDALSIDPDLTPTQLAATTGIPRTSINRYLKSMRNGKVQSKPAVMNKQPDTTPATVGASAGPVADIQKRAEDSKYSVLQRKYQDALNIIEEQGKTLETLIAVGSSPQADPIVYTGSGERREVVPVVVASDWHIEEQVKREATNGKNEYNLEIAERSVAQFFTNACELINQSKRDSKISTVVLAVLGDIINGVLREEDLSTNQQTSIESLSTARTLLHRGIQQMVESTGCRIRVICCVGNHGRLTSKIFPSDQVHHSLEYLIYKMLESDFKNHDKVEVIVSEAGYYIQDIYGVRVRFHHGHTFKFNGGIGGLSVPVLRKISQLNLIEQADLDVCGHFHSMQIFPNCILNGSLVGANGYSIQLGIPFEPPRQVFFLIDSKYGRSVVAPIFIDRDVHKEAINQL